MLSLKEIEMIVKKAKVVEPTKDGILLSKHLDTGEFKSVCMLFYHGVGDTCLFLAPFARLQMLYPDIDFTFGLPKGLTHEELLDETFPYILLDGGQFNEKAQDLPFDLVVRTLFPMSEAQTELTKGEYCCIYELGIDPVCGYESLRQYDTKLACVTFQITCLPDSCNPDCQTAERIWNDILASGWIPLETHFTHIFHNPVNTKFDFIDATVRRCQARVSSLVGLIQNAGAFIGTVGGAFHVAMATLPPKRVFLLEKDFKRECFTKEDIARADLRNYQGEVKTFLEKLEAEK